MPTCQCNRSVVWFFFLFGSLIVPAFGQGSRLTEEKLYELGRIGDAVISSDGTQLAYAVTRYNLAENAGLVSVLVQSIPADTTSSAEQTKSIAFGTNLRSSSAQTHIDQVKGLNSLSWINRPDGLYLLYIAPGKMDEIETPQAWLSPLNKPDQAVQITNIPEGIANLKPAPTGDRIAFTVNIKLDQTVSELYPDLPKADARIIDSLLFRHWDSWHDFTYSHLHVAELSESGRAEKVLNLMENLRSSCPLPPMGGAEQFEFSPDGNEIALTLKLVNNPAESTDSGIYLVPSTGGELKHITPGMPGYDLEPRYSTDGRQIAFLSMARAGFEADRNRIMLYDRATGLIREATIGLDQTCHAVRWSHDSRRLFFHSEFQGTQQVFSLEIDAAGLNMPAQATQLTDGWFDFSLLSAIPSSDLLLVKQQNMLRPNELAIVDCRSRQLSTVTDVNGSLFASLELPQVQQRHFTATDGQSIHCWLIVPPNFHQDPKQQFPMLTYCQGGPQGQIGQWFSYRWNFHLMAAKGYAVLAVNRRGLPGFGQQWNDQISKDWGGQAMQDILVSTDGMLADPKIDRQRVAAIGASFGGYTVYWLMGNSQKRFCAMIAHCGVFNLESMYGSTEELFFVNWDLGGPYWKNSEVAADYQRFSPHRFVANWETPLLVIHGEKDFRVPVTQGIEAFTAAQVQGVPSRFLYFPEEGHWVVKPQNGVLWSRVFFDWLDLYCKRTSGK